ncbi:MAG: ribosome maturation factor RimM [Alphaproteobacteria bacterium]|nr:ribosome maturation factor RimM [Alphaproteobacteria bacterium]
MASSLEDKMVCLAMITTAHGVKGQVKVKSWTKEPKDFASFDCLYNSKGDVEFKVKIVGQIKEDFIVSIVGINDRNQAEALRGTKLYVKRSMLPKLSQGQFYHTDLVGLMAKTMDGKELGRVKAVYNFGAGDMLEVGDLVDYLPFTNLVVPEIDIENGFVLINMPDYVEVKSEK